MFNHISEYKGLLIYFILLPTFLLIAAAIANTAVIICLQNSTKQVVMSLFSVNTNQMEELINKNQEFAGIIKGHTEMCEISSNLSDPDEERQTLNVSSLSDRLTGQRKMNSKYVVNNIGNMLFRIMRYLFVYLIFESFYIFYYFSNAKWSDSFATFKTEFNQTGQATIFYLNTMALTE